MNKLKFYKGGNIMKKSGLKQAGEIITLIGAILETIFHALLLIYSEGVWLIFAAVFIPLLWISRNNAVGNQSKGWMIYGIIQSVFFNWVGLVGYILLLIDKVNLDNKIKKENEVNQNTSE